MKDTQTHTVENERTPNQRDRDGRGRKEGGEQGKKQKGYFFGKWRGMS